MKYKITTLILIFTCSVYAQSKAIAGNYEKTHDNEQGIISYKLSLNPDGTFIFHVYDKIFERISQERNKYGKGTWKAEKNLIYFSSDEQSDFNDKYTLDFSNTKARFITKSPRDKSDRVIKTSILFYESDIFWIKRWKLFKNE